MRCPGCGAEQPEGQAFCDQCGSKLPISLPPTVNIGRATGAVIRCPNCGHDNPPGSNFCEECGADLLGVTQLRHAPSQAASVYPATPLPPAPPMSPPGQPPTQRTPRSSTAPPAQAAEPPNTPTQKMPGGLVTTQRYDPNAEPGEVLPRMLSSNGVVITFKSGQNTWTIGREDPVSGVYPDVDLTPFDPEYTVSRRHAQLAVMNGQATLTSLTHTNWTRLNGQRLAADQPTPIKAGDRIEFAHVTMTFQI